MESMEEENEKKELVEDFTDAVKQTLEVDGTIAEEHEEFGLQNAEAEKRWMKKVSNKKMLKN